MHLSIVMPVYNEAAVIADVLADLEQEIASRIPETEIVMVDDASTDETGAILDRLKAANPRVVVHHAPRNRGHGPTLRQAIDASRGEWIFQIDSDGQQVPSEFWHLWQARERAELTMGVRTNRHDGAHRRLVSALAGMSTRALGGGGLRDVNVPFKLFRRSVWVDLERDIPAEPIAPSMLVALGCGLRGWRVQQVAISHRPRLHAPSSINLRRLVSLSAGALRELVAFRLRAGRRPRPAAAQPSPEAAAPTH